MGERNLRAIDLRHTLPNLHNLMLTITSGRGAELKFRWVIVLCFPFYLHLSHKQAFRRRKRPRIPNLGGLPAASSIISASYTLTSDTSEVSSPAMTVPSTPRESEIIPTLPAEPSTPTPAVTPPEERRTFYSPLASFLRARYPSVRTIPLPSTGNGGPPKPKSSLANEVQATSPATGEPFQSHGDTSESQTTSEDEDDVSLADIDIAETATLRGTPTASRASRAGSTSTVKASISIEAPEGTANEKTIRSTSGPPKVIQEST